jgi:hypothetical protein
VYRIAACVEIGLNLERVALVYSGLNLTKNIVYERVRIRLMDNMGNTEPIFSTPFSWKVFVRASNLGPQI